MALAAVIHLMVVLAVALAAAGPAAVITAAPFLLGVPAAEMTGKLAAVAEV
jgi:hypothetical protein